MNYVIVVLGILLAAAGCLSIYDGYEIIQVERGWTEVIAGSTALTGGIVTIALWSILRRLQRLTDLYEAAVRPPAAPDVVPVEPRPIVSTPAMVEPRRLVATPATHEANATTRRDVPPQPFQPVDLDEVPQASPEPAYVPALEPAFAESVRRGRKPSHRRDAAARAAFSRRSFAR